MDKFTVEYIQSKRKKYFFSITLICIFGLVLYFFNKTDIETLEEQPIEKKGMTDLYGNITRSTAEEPLKKSSNILEDPKFLSCRIEGEKLFIEKPFTLNGKKISDAVFQIKRHGNTLFSEDFSCDDPTLHCKGTIKEGSEKFMIYYCAKK